jgi:AAA+ ATPase superfamily predicted ATPase
VGRKNELELLKRTLDSSRPTISVIYGRRRVGKSFLISKALEKKEALYFEGLEKIPKKQQIANFCLQLSKQTGEQIHKVPESWGEAFLLLETPMKETGVCLVLDEFQWMANYRTEIIANLKMVWDQYLSKISGSSMILSGSIASFMLTKVVRSNALYGRTDRVIHLRPFLLSETKLMLPHYGQDELIEAQMLLGGIPKYLELIKSYPSLYLAIDDLAFSENGYFVDEFNRIFVSHFGRNDDYKSIIDALAKHSYGLFRKELVQKTGVDAGGGLTRLLEDLESAGFISALRPLSKGVNTKLIRYILSDEFINFYYALMKNNDQLKSNQHSAVKFTDIIQTSEFRSWRGRAFEILCMSHAKKIAEILGFSGIDYSFGPYFRSPTKMIKGLQVDLAFDRADHVLTVCEMKSSRNTIGVEVLKEIENRTALLKELFPRKTIQNVLIYTGSISKELEYSPYLYKKIKAEELI